MTPSSGPLSGQTMAKCDSSSYLLCRANRVTHRNFTQTGRKQHPKRCIVAKHHLLFRFRAVVMRLSVLTVTSLRLSSDATVLVPSVAWGCQVLPRPGVKSFQKEDDTC